MKINKTIEELIKELEGTPTIEQRAKAYSKTQAIECYAYCGYDKGATEQRDIDTNRAIEWLSANWRKYIDHDADGLWQL